MMLAVLFLFVGGGVWAALFFFKSSSTCFSLSAALNLKVGWLFYFSLRMEGGGWSELWTGKGVERGRERGLRSQRKFKLTRQSEQGIVSKQGRQCWRGMCHSIHRLNM